MFHLQVNPRIFRKNVRDVKERNSHFFRNSSIWWKLFMLFKLLRGCLGILGWAIEVVKIITPLIILLPVLFSDLLKSYIEGGSDEILELYFPFCHKLSWWADSVDNSDDDLEVSGICFSAFYSSIQIQDPKGSPPFSFICQ